jgi:hypothetical protein
MIFNPLINVYVRNTYNLVIVFLIVINECDNETCFNNGTCADLDGLSTWRCDCVMGYTGTHGETGTALY